MAKAKKKKGKDHSDFVIRMEHLTNSLFHISTWCLEMRKLLLQFDPKMPLPATKKQRDEWGRPGNKIPPGSQCPPPEEE